MYSQSLSNVYPGRQSLPTFFFYPSFIAKHDVMQYRAMFGPVQVSCSNSVASNFFPAPADSLRGQSGKSESLDAEQVLFSSNQNIGALSMLF